LKAVILAGGLGTRLHPLTVNLPKPMVPMLGRPLMSYIVELLAKHGFNDISALLYHQPESIKNYFKDGKLQNVKIDYVSAPKDYGTAGAVKFACQKLEDLVLVISADLVCEVDLAAALDFHKKKKSFATMVLTRVKNPLPYGIVITDTNGKIIKFLEKPSLGEVFSDTINAGIYILEPQVLDFIPEEKPFDFSQDLFPLLLAEKKPLFGYITEEYWKDIGQLEDYSSAHLEVLKTKLNGGLLLRGENVTISESAALDGAVMIGDNSVIFDGVKLSNTVMGKNCKIEAGACLSDCVLWDGVKIAAEATLERVIVCNKVKIGMKACLEEGVVVGDESEIGAKVKIKPFIKVWPNKTIEDESTVSSSVIWREHFRKSIFGQFGVTGTCGTEITPQFAAALGTAYGSILGSGARISCSRDSHKASRMIYRALISGVISTGVSISNLEIVPIPLNRYEIRSLKSQGGFHVRKSPFDQETLDIKFFDAEGMDLSPAAEKKIERIFFGEDFLQTNMEGTGESQNPVHRVVEEYKAGMLYAVDLLSLKSSGLKIVIDYAFGSASLIFPAILGELGLEVVSLDAHIDPAKITKDKTTFDKSLRQMKNIVKSVEADIGIMLDTGGEKIFICDETGQIIEGSTALAIMVLMALKSKKGAAIALPIRESRVMEEIAQKYKGKIMRTKNTFRGMMETAQSGSVDFLGEQFGGYIFPNFMPAFDGMLSTLKIIEFLCREKVKLSQLAAEIPPINLAKIEIRCPVDQKGTLMRKCLDKCKGADRIETLDGIKFWHGNDWVLILPDPVKPSIRIYAEADSEKEMQTLLGRYAKTLEKLKSVD
jgi:mannose-1-phosphate guanylyltransferase/phosphomannomutase